MKRKKKKTFFIGLVGKNKSKFIFKASSSYSDGYIMRTRLVIFTQGIKRLYIVGMGYSCYSYKHVYVSMFVGNLEIGNLSFRQTQFQDVEHNSSNICICVRKHSLYINIHSILY